jgi:hypothetical protein
MIGNVPSLAPVGIPKGVDPRTWRQAVEKRLNELLDQSLALITALDMMEVDPDFEPDEGGEPWLGWPIGGGLATSQQTFETIGGTGPLNDDRESDASDWEDGGDSELECEDEGAQCDDEGVIWAL